jgi:putative DNA primase/helicase
MLTAAEIAHALGGQVSSRDTALVPGPGHSRRDRSLSVRVDPNAPDGFLIYSHAGDPWRECREHVRRALGLPEWAPGDQQLKTVPKRRIREWDLAAIESDANDVRPRSEDDLLRISRAQHIWDDSKDPQGTLAERYLRHHRGLVLSDVTAGAVLRLHPRCPWRNEDTGNTDFVPALIAAFRSIDDNEICGIHRIALNPDGSKLGRRMFGVVHRAAIKLNTATDNLVIGEGVETGLAAMQLGFAPAWALGSVGAISFFPVIDGIQQLTILGETGQASAEAVRICGERWRRAGRRVRVIMPRTGSDLNDEILQKGETYAASA